MKNIYNILPEELNRIDDKSNNREFQGEKKRNKNCIMKVFQFNEFLRKKIKLARF